MCAAITAGLASAVTFRRRDFEAAALFREVACRFAGVALPPPSFLPPRPGAALNRNLNNSASAVAGGREPAGPRTVLVLHMPATGGDILAALEAALAARDDDSPGEGWVQAVRTTPGGLEAVVLLPHGPEAPEAVRFPQPVTVETDGTIKVPRAKPARRR